MAERVPIPKTMRFEVFKRDSFTCQYCGEKSPEVVLHCDHIKPVAAGGATELLNLVTACNKCNLGKGAVELDDMSAIERQRRQIEELNERRLQLEMMLQWRDELAKHQVDEVAVVAAAIGKKSRFLPNDKGKAHLRRWIRKHGLSETLAAMDEAFDLYLKDDTEESWNDAFNRIGRIVAIRQQEKTDPNIRKLLYIQAILRNRWKMPRLQCVDALRQRLEAGYRLDAIEAAARTVREEGDWKSLDESSLRIMKQTSPVAAAKAADEDQEDAVEDDVGVVGWPEAQWRGEMLAGALAHGAILKELAGDCGVEGYVDQPLASEYEWVPRGLIAVGQVNRIGGVDPFDGPDDAGNYHIRVRVRPIAPTEVANCFNRFGALRLGFWATPQSFADVSQVY